GAVVLRTWLDARANQPVADVTGFLRAKMPERVRVPVRAADWAVEVNSEEVAPSRVRAGQEIVAGEGEVVAFARVDQTGEAYGLPHPAARTPVRRSAGQALLAGARVVEGDVRVLATRVGDERALVRPSSFGDPRSHRSATLTV